MKSQSDPSRDVPHINFSFPNNRPLGWNRIIQRQRPHLDQNKTPAGRFFSVPLKNDPLRSIRAWPLWLRMKQELGRVVFCVEFCFFYW